MSPPWGEQMAKEAFDMSQRYRLADEESPMFSVEGDAARSCFQSLPEFIQRSRSHGRL